MLLYSRVAVPKAPKKRSRAGCNYCKDKKKKCDEARPTCSRCQEHGESCHYDPVKPRQRRKVEAAGKNVSGVTFSGFSEDSGHVECVQGQLAEPQLALIKTSDYHEGDHPILWETAGFLSTDHGYDSFSAISPDLPFPLNDQDQLLLDGFKVPSNSSRSPTLALITPAVNPSPLLEFCAPAFWEFSNDRHHRFLTHHFCNTLSHLIVLGEDEGNPFQQLVLPLAYNSRAVKGAIYALASAHLEGKGVRKLDNDDMSIQFHSEAIRNLAKLIQKGDNANKTELLATVILLVYYEVLVQRRRSNLVEGHLKGAMAIMQNGASQNDRTCLFLDRAFRFYDVIAALSSGNAPVSDDPSRDSFTGLLKVDSSSPGSVDALLGLATSLWPIIHRLSGLLSLKNAVEESVASGDISGNAELRATFDSKCAAVESCLQEWQPMIPADCDLQTSLESKPRAKTKQFQSIFNTALAYRHSALVYLYRTIYDCPRDHPMVQRHTSIALVHCEATVRHEGPMGALLWPLFVASCEAVKSADRDLAGEAFRGIVQRQGMANIDRAWEVVQEVWNRADAANTVGSETIIGSGQGTKDLWRRVSEDMGMTIVFG